MNIKCTICHNLLEIKDKNQSTHCGHLFHYTCLVNWLNRSQTCPQCRRSCTKSSIHAVYFNADSDDPINKSLKNEMETLVTTVQTISSAMNFRLDKLENMIKERLPAKSAVHIKTFELPKKGANDVAVKTSNFTTDPLKNAADKTSDLPIVPKKNTNAVYEFGKTNYFNCTPFPVQTSTRNTKKKDFKSTGSRPASVRNIDGKPNSNNVPTNVAFPNLMRDNPTNFHFSLLLPSTTLSRNLKPNN